MTDNKFNPPPADSHEFRFEIGAFHKDAFPMAILAEYLSDLAVIYGQKDKLYFLRLDEGSTVAVTRAEPEIEPEVESRLQLVETNEAPPDVMQAFQRLDARLRTHRTSGVIIGPSGAKILSFPGADIEVSEPLAYGPFTQPGTLEGVPIMIGGKDRLVPIHLEDRSGDRHICYAKRSLAKEIAPYLFETVIRIEGTGRWLRHENGDWEMKRFTALDFRPIRNTTIEDDIARLQAIPGKWKESKDPIRELDIIRHEDDIQ